MNKWSAMDEMDKRAACALGCCTFLPGAPAKGFAQEMAAKATRANAPLPTATQKARFAIVTVRLEDARESTAVAFEVANVGWCLIADICLRMFTPRELARCQGFPDSYVFTDKTQADQVARIGNSVPPQLAEAMVRANFTENA